MGKIGWSGICRYSAFAFILLASCKPPATDGLGTGAKDTVDGGAGDRGAGDNAAVSRMTPSAPIESPDTKDAVWVTADDGAFLRYGTPGEMPLVALRCEHARNSIGLTRYASADANAEALMALIGNGHIARLPVDAVQRGRAWVWHGRYGVEGDDLDALRGSRAVELTIPGAGSVILNASEKPGMFMAACRAGSALAPD